MIFLQNSLLGVCVSLENMYEVFLICGIINYVTYIIDVSFLKLL